MNPRVIEAGQDERDSMVAFNCNWIKIIVTQDWAPSEEVWNEELCVCAIRWCLYWIGLREERPPRIEE